MIGVIVSIIIVLLFIGLLLMIIANMPLPTWIKNAIYILAAIGVIIMLCHFAGVNLGFGFLK